MISIEETPKETYALTQTAGIKPSLREYLIMIFLALTILTCAISNLALASAEPKNPEMRIICVDKEQNDLQNWP